GFFILNSYIYREKQSALNNYEPYRGTLTGEYLCLPRTDATEEDCRYGIKTDAGEYYAVDFYLMSQQVASQVAIGERLTANGLITPIERLSTNTWDPYPIEGIFSVTDTLIRE